jgi:hypothetical protein
VEGQSYEYYDEERECRDIGTFVSVNSLDELKDGDKVISPPKRKWNGVSDLEGNLLLLEVEGSRPPYHIGFKDRIGMIAFNLLMKEI